MVRWSSGRNATRRSSLHRWRPGNELDGHVLDTKALLAATDRALAHREERALLVVQLDGAPDIVMAAAEARILGTIRPADLLGRLDDGRFAILTEESDGRGDAERIAARLSERLSETFNVGGEHVIVRPRIGVAFGEGGSDTAAKALLRAERALR